MKTITFRRPSDYHLHVRQGERMRNWAPFSAEFGRILVMPNTHPPIRIGAQAKLYGAEVEALLPGTEVVPTIQITPDTTAEVIFDAKNEHGILAGKIYPLNLTSNSEYGFSADAYRLSSDIFSAMQECGMLLLLHGELPGAWIDTLYREREFLGVVDHIHEEFPRLKIVLEHITSAAAVEFVADECGENVAATITVHHLFLTQNDLFEPKLAPHHFCKPVAKLFSDRRELVSAVLSGNPKFFLGTDSAPWQRGEKECASGCAGVFTAPVAIPLLVEFLAEHQRLDLLEGFTSTFGDQFYGLPHVGETVTAEQSAWVVPNEYAGVVPFRAGETIGWRIK